MRIENNIVYRDPDETVIIEILKDGTVIEITQEEFENNTDPERTMIRHIGGPAKTITFSHDT